MGGRSHIGVCPALRSSGCPGPQEGETPPPKAEGSSHDPHWEPRVSPYEREIKTTAEDEEELFKIQAKLLPFAYDKPNLFVTTPLCYREQNFGANEAT